MFHFQTVTRTTYYEHGFAGSELDHCYDCAAETMLLELWVRRYGGGASEEDTRAQVHEMSGEISRRIAQSRTKLNPPQPHSSTE